MRIGAIRFTAILLVAVTVLAVIRPKARAPVLAQAPAAEFRLVATHPQAARQPSVRGKTLGVLEPWQGRLYAGYGDYGDNTGPISISPFDPATGTFEELWVSDTEAIENYRPIRGRLYAPAIDRKRQADYAVGEPWSDVGTLNTTHAYDMVTLDGTDLWLVGSQGENATAWRSLDDGASWQRSLQVPESHGRADDFARFYFAAALGNYLFVQASDYYGGAHATSKVFDGTRWSDGPDLLPTGGMGWRPVRLGRRLFYRSSEQGGSLVVLSPVITSGTNAALGFSAYVVGWQALDVVVADGFLTVLRAERDAVTGRFGAPGIARTADMDTWEVLDTPAPEGSRSLAWLNGVPYLGATDARLFALEGAQTWQPSENTVVWNRPPAISLLTPTDGAHFEEPATISILAEASDPDGDLAKVMFWHGSTLLGDDTTSPYSLTWRDVMSGTYRLDVRAVDSANAFEDVFATITVGPRTQPEPSPAFLPFGAR